MNIATTLILLFLIFFFTFTSYRWMFKCDKLSNENMKLLTENMAIHELYLNRTKCQCQKTVSNIPLTGSGHNTGIGGKILKLNTNVIKNKTIGNL